MEIAFSELKDAPLERLHKARDELQPDEILILTDCPEHARRNSGISNAKVLDIAKTLGFEELEALRHPESSASFKLRLKRKPRVHFSVRRDTDYTDFSTAFRKVFDKDMERAFFSWKYGEDQGSALIARDQKGNFVGHYGFIRRWIHFEGRRVIALQVCDVFTTPGERGVLSRRGTFHMLARLFQTLYLNEGAEAAFAYGFPNPRAMAVAGFGKVYLQSDRILQCRWPRKTPPDQWLHPWRLVCIEPGDLPGAILERLWSKMRKALHSVLLQERNTAYIRQRYVQHPLHRYRFFLFSSRFPILPAKALLIVREDEDATRLMDFVGHPRDFSSAIQSLIRFLSEENREASPLLAWVTPTILPFLKNMTHEAEETGISIPVNAHVKTFPWSQIRDRWWTSFGDTDFL